MKPFKGKEKNIYNSIFYSTLWLPVIECVSRSLDLTLRYFSVTMLLSNVNFRGCYGPRALRKNRESLPSAVRCVESKKKCFKNHRTSCEFYCRPATENSKNFLKKKHTTLLKKDSSIQRDLKKISREEEEFFNNIYKAENTSPEKDSFKQVFESADLATLNDDEAESCKGLLTRKECADALGNLHSNKTPGSDGFTIVRIL